MSPASVSISITSCSLVCIQLCAGEYYFGTTAHEARQILDRRHERLQGRLDTSTTDMASLETSLQVLSGPLASDEHERVEEGEAEGIAEICEEYNEFLHGTPPKREASSGMVF